MRTRKCFLEQVTEKNRIIDVHHAVVQHTPKLSKTLCCKFTLRTVFLTRREKREKEIDEVLRNVSALSLRCLFLSCLSLP